MNKNIITAEQLPENEKVYLKKDFLGWRIVHPIRNEDGTINKINLIFGGKRNLAILLGLIIIVLLFTWLHYRDVGALQQQYSAMSSDPIGWCKAVCLNPGDYTNNPKLNISNIVLLNE